MQTLSKAAFLAVLILLGYQDVTRRRVRNLTLSLLFLVSLPGVFLSAGQKPQSLALLFWALVVVASVILYSMKIVGAGDVKALAISSLWGFGLYGLRFLWAFLLLGLLDHLWFLRYRRQDLGAPLVWLWAWSCTVVVGFFEFL